MRKSSLLFQAVKCNAKLAVAHVKWRTRNYLPRMKHTFWDFFRTSSTNPNIDLVKKLKRAPTVYCFKIGNSQTLASDKSSASNLSGRRLKKISGPMAPSADPTHSCSCRMTKISTQKNPISNQPSKIYSGIYLKWNK